MTSHEIERAWKDGRYRASLTEAERQELPDHPSGLVEIPDPLLDSVAGGTSGFPCGAASLLISCSINCDTVAAGTCHAFTIGCCPHPT
jgi:mersacidin/lichenicidin family type 2 lantibiotic